MNLITKTLISPVFAFSFQVHHVHSLRFADHHALGSFRHST